MCRANKRNGITSKRGSKDALKKVWLLVVGFLKKKKGTQGKAAELFGLSLDGVHKDIPVNFKFEKVLPKIQHTWFTDSNYFLFFLILRCRHTFLYAGLFGLFCAAVIFYAAFLRAVCFSLLLVMIAALAVIIPKNIQHFSVWAALAFIFCR